MGMNYVALCWGPRIAHLAALLGAVGCVLSASAQQPDLKVNLVAQRVVTDRGKESLVAADKAKPGDVIQYEAVYKNGGAGAARNINAVIPIPMGLALLADTATPPAKEGSLDGKNFQAFPLTHEVKNAAGTVEKQPVPLAEYRALRWTLSELSAGQSAIVHLRARVNANGSRP